MAVWVVRGGRNGEREQEALEDNILGIGFGGLQDLSTTQTREQATRLVREDNPGAKDGSVIAWTSSVWAFRDGIKRGDLIVMPRKWQGVIAIGEMVGDYEFRPDTLESGHRRAVKWINREVSKDSLEEDLRTSLERPPTVYQLKSGNAEQRLRAIAETNPWDGFVKRAQEYVDTGRLEQEEIEYKVETGRRLSEAREAVLAATDGWDDLVKRGIAGNLIFRIGQAKFRDWINQSPGQTMHALQELWTRDDSSVAKRLRDFSVLLPSSASSGTGSRTTVASVLLMALDVEQYPPFRVGYYSDAYTRTGYGQPTQSSGRGGDI